MSISPGSALTRRGEQIYWAIPTNGDAPRQIATMSIRESERNTRWLQWSPDSQYLLINFHGAVYNLAGERVLTGGIGSWVPNQEEATVTFYENKRYKLITIGGQEATIVTSGPVSNAAFSKDGQRFAYFLGDSNQARLKVFELGENKNIDVAPLATNMLYLRKLSWNADSSSLIYQHTNFSGNPEDDSIWIVPAEANQSPIELFSPGVLVGVVPMP